MQQWENRQITSLGIAAGLIVLALAMLQVVINGADWQQLDSLREVLKRGFQFFKLDLSELSNLPAPLIEVIVMAFCGSLAGGILALANIFLIKRMAAIQSPFFSGLPKWLFASCGAVHELVWALLLISLLGPGLAAGAIALGLASAGRIARQLSGAKGSSRVSSAHTLKLLLAEGNDNLGRAVVLGLVGVGGLGLAFYRNLVADNFGAAAVALIVALALIAAGQALNYFLAARPLKSWHGVNAPAPADDVPSVNGMAIGSVPVYGLFILVAGAVVMLILHTFGVVSEPKLITNALVLREEELFAGLIWAIAETLQILFVAIALGTMAVAVLMRLISVRIAGVQSVLTLASQTIVILALALPAVFAVLLCRAVIGTGAFAGVIALTLATIGLIGRELIFPHTAEDGTNRQSQHHGPGIYAGLAADAFARLLPVAAIMGFFGAGGTGWLLRLTMQHGSPGQSLGALVVIVTLMLLSQAGYESLRGKRMSGERTETALPGEELRQS